MFIRKGMDIRISKVYKNFEDCKEDWNGFSRSARINVKEFMYDPDNFLYYRARAITADVSNSNGDYFPIKEVKAAYESFIGKGVYLNHDNDIPEKAFGLVLDAEMVETPTAERSHGTGYVEILAAVDKELAEELHPGLLRRIQSGIINSTSMSCFIAGSKVILSDGSAQSIEDVQVGDEVLTHTGHTAAVTETMQREYTGDLYTINLTGLLEPLCVTPEHPILVYREYCQCGCKEVLPTREPWGGLRRGKFIDGHHNKFINLYNGRKEDITGELRKLQEVETSKVEWVAVKDLTVSDTVLLPKKKSVVGQPISTGMARLFGYFIAEGSYIKHKGKRNGLDFCFNITEANTLVYEVCNLLLLEFNVTAHAYTYKEKNAIHVRVHNNSDLAEVFFKACGEYSNGKHLPDDIFSWDEAAKLNLIGAYLNGDGCLIQNNERSSCKITSATVSERLCYQLNTLFRTLDLYGGFYSRDAFIDKYGSKKQKAFYCNLQANAVQKLQKYTTFCDETDVEGKLTGNNVIVSVEGYIGKRISAIEKSHFSGTVYNLEVEGDHSYLIEGVAVHNCFATAASCCICNNMAHTPQELCAHMNPGTFSYIKGKRIDPYDIAYEINYGITFTEDSLVDNPADSTARIFEVMSSANASDVDKMSVGELKTKLKEILALLEGVQTWKN